MFHITVVQAAIIGLVFFVLDFVNFGLMYTSKEDGRTAFDTAKSYALVAAQVAFIIYLALSFFVLR